MKVQAWQHVYSNVEKEQSPTGQGGFQTLFYTTDGLTAAEISEMEGRLLYFPARDVEPVKRLFFTTTTNKAVIAQIVSLPEPDQFGRKGRYLAHALVFTLSDLAKFEADPFRVFRHFRFFTTVAEAQKQADFQRGHIPAVTLDVEQAEGQAGRAWSPAELKKLALLALRVEQHADRREAITFAGPPAEIEQALETAFLVVPTPLRPRCTFDTYFYRCNLVATFYWSIGLPDPPASFKFALVDATARTVQGVITPDPETAYERWVLARLNNSDVDKTARFRDQAFALGTWLDGQEAESALLDRAPASLVTEFFDVNDRAVRTMLRRKIGKVLPEALAERAAAEIYRGYKAPALFQQLRQGFTTAQLLDVLYQSYEAQNFAKPAGDELKALTQVLAETDHSLLRLFVAYWRGARPLSEMLEQVDEATYRQFVEIVLRLNLIDPPKVLISGWADTFLEMYLATGVEDWVALVEALINSGQVVYLSRLTPYLSRLSAKEIGGIDRLTKEVPGIPQDFLAALQAAKTALPPEKGFKDFLKAAWQRLPGVDRN